MSASRRATRATPAPDAGFTLVELLTAMAIFSVLMVMVGAVTLSGFSAIREVTSRSETQQDAQTAAEWATRLIRYAIVPENKTTAFEAVGPNLIDLYTYSGTGPKNDVPYRARLSVVTNADGTRSLVSDVYTPTAVPGGWTWDAAPVRRDLMRLPAGSADPLSVRLYRCPTTTECVEPEDVTPTIVTSSVTPGEGYAFTAVEVSIGDLADARNRITQRVRLVNLS
jgi:prepilin-type N-terminal cleavage/methylation domain-containing protein